MTKENRITEGVRVYIERDTHDWGNARKHELTADDVTDLDFAIVDRWAELNPKVKALIDDLLNRK